MTATAATLTIEETAQLLGIGRSAAYAAAGRDELPVPVIRVGRRLLVSRHRLEALLGIPNGSASPNGDEPRNAESHADERGSRTTLGFTGAEGRGLDES